MQHLMLGASGSGKGYEACAFQILPALLKGRRVITNMPLDLEKWAQIDPAFPGLIEVRTRAQPIKGTWNPTDDAGAYQLFEDGRTDEPSTTARCFAGVWDYYTTWKHPKTGQGPLFVVDEAQYVIPVSGCDKQVEEWSALHRHFNCDVLFMTQSYGTLSKIIRGNVQMVYRLRKKVAWGQPDRYIRKVQDGLRGEVMNVGERKYDPQYFGLWKSHTQGSAAEEFNADDVKPIWRHWSFMGAGIMAVVFVGLLLSGKVGNPMAVKVPKHGPQAVAVQKLERVEPAPVGAVVVAQVESPRRAAVAVERDPEAKPFDGLGIHIGGYVEMRGVKRYLLTLSQNGQNIQSINDAELVKAGYEWDAISDCAARVSWKGEAFYVRCDMPTQTAVGSRRGT